MAALVGINEKMMFKLDNYKSKDSESVVANILGLFLTLTSAIAVYIQIRPEFRRGFTVPGYRECPPLVENRS